MSKIKTLDELEEILSIDRDNKIVVHCHGVFDLIHPGHIKHLQAAKLLGNILVVTITADQHVNKGPGRPAFNQRLRAESLAAFECVDYVAINESPTAVDCILKIRPNLYVKGKDYIDPVEDLTGAISSERNAVESIGGKIHFTDEIAFSSTNLLNQYFNVYSDNTSRYLELFRKKYSSDQIITMLKDLSKMKIMVIGDPIIDQYCYCSSMNKSPKENIIPAKYISEESFAGGVFAVANHIAGFCDKVNLVTCIGLKNSYADFIASHTNRNILSKFFYRNDTQTIVKRRFVDPIFMRKLFEISYLDDHAISSELSSEIIDYLVKNIPDYDLVLVTDFGHGMLTPDIISVLCERSKCLAVNAQTNSANVGFNMITKYSSVDYICIDEPEIRFACQDRVSDLDILTQDISARMQCSHATVTHSRFETLTYSNKEGIFKTPVFSSNVIDTMGAGDALLAITSPLVAAGTPMDIVGFVGNAVGALKVQIIGNKSSIDPVSLYKFIVALLK